MPINFPLIRSLLPNRGDRARIARELGVSEASLARTLSGRHPDMPISRVEALARVLGVTVADLLADAPPPESP